MLHSQLPDTFMLKPHTDLARDSLHLLDKAQRVTIVKSNPAIFGEYYVKPYTRKWGSDTALHQYYMLEQMMANKNIVIHVPVEHAKSTWFSLVVPLWMLCLDRNTQGCIISNTSRQAEGFLRAIKWHIEHNPRLKEDFGDYLVPRKPTRKDPIGKWTDTVIMVHRDEAEQSKDPTILAIGTGGAMLGARFDWVIADDILDLKNTQTEALRTKVKVWWDEIVDSRVIEDGRRIVLGTLQHTKDLLCYLSDNKSYSYVHLTALDEYNTPLWPEQWSYERIMQKKDSIGTISFLKTMQNDRTAGSNKMLDPTWINYWDVLPQKIRYYIGVDPAICDDRTTAEKKQQDKFGLVVCGFDMVSKNIYLVEEYEEWLTFPEQLRVIERYNLKYRPVKIGIESVQYQKALAQQAMLLQSLPPIAAINVGTQSKATRIEGFAVHCENKRFWINRKHKLFEEQWVNFEPGGKSPNVLDACVIIMIMVRKQGGVKDIHGVKNDIRQVNW